jgi:phosphopantetheinyl transferase (holo-ACP synthase)
MDSLITAAALALSAGDPLGALNRVALRDDPPALALRGIAMAQLGEFARAKALLRSAARAFGAKEAVSRARCIVAEAEVALASRDLGWRTKWLDAARVTLEAHGDHANAACARYLELRRQLLTGQLDVAEQALDAIDPTVLPPALRAAHELVVTGVAMRRLRTQEARMGLVRAEAFARDAGIPALLAEVQSAAAQLDAPAARLIARGDTRSIGLDEVASLLASPTLVVDACRLAVSEAGTVVSLASRPVLFALARTLAEAWPDDVARDTLIAHAFRTRHADETLRARLRVEIGRLRAVLSPMAGIHATKRGFRIGAVPSDRSREVLAQPVEDAHAMLLASLADGEAWSSSSLALALGASQLDSTSARDTGSRRQGAVDRARPRPALDHRADARFHDNLVTPRAAARRLA